MTKKEKKVLKESIETLLGARTDMVGMINKITEKQYPNLNDFMRHRSFHTRTIRISFDKPLIKLNDLLDKSEQVDEVLEIQKEMAKIHSKKYITTSQFTDIYNKSKDWQTQKRKRMKNKLPSSKGKGRNSQILYNAEVVEDWMRRNNYID